MKKILIAATMIIAITTAAFADGKKANAKLLTDLKTTLKTLDESAWKTTENYKKTSFSFNGKSTNAFVNPETGDLIGFSISIAADALPEGTAENVARKFKDWQMINPIMFIEASGNIAYYVQVSKGKNSLALKISSKGKPGIYGKIPH